jgi:AbrB family looped-hinge helix DNA binding protein
MSEKWTRKIGERGQVTIPHNLREEFGLEGGDEVSVREDDGRIVLEKAVTRSDLAEGYRRRAEDMTAIAEEMEDVSTEADEALGDAPEWG